MLNRTVPAIGAAYNRIMKERWAAIPLRLIVGYGFMAHGYAKIVPGPEHFVGILHAIGIPAPEILGWATIIVELVGGLAVLAGACAWARFAASSARAQATWQRAVRPKIHCALPHTIA